jgi:hypothetical protein
MKKIALAAIACLSIGASAFAGHEMKEYKQPLPEPCFHDQELQLDIFGLYGWGTDGSNDSGAGGGLGVNYFWQRNLGVGIDGYARDGGSTVWGVSASLIVRFPIETGSLCLAPYILGGGGYQENGVSAGSFHAGGGLEFRLTPTLGIFTEGRYIWAGPEDSAHARLGVRLVF